MSHPYLKRAGRNRFEESYHEQRPSPLGFDFDSGLPVNNTIQVQRGESDLGEGVDEVLPAEGDSGGPTFIHGVVAGVHAFSAWPWQGDINDLFDGSFGEVDFSTMTSDDRSFITTATDGEVRFLDVLGDFNLDGKLDASDIDELAIRMQAGDTPAFYDLNDDGLLDSADRQTWVWELF